MSDDRLKAQFPATGALPQEMARNVSRANRRRELIAALPPGDHRPLQPSLNGKANEWAPRGYWLHHGFKAGGNTDIEPDPTEVCRLHGQASRPVGGCEAVLLLSGLYRVQLLEENESHQELKSKSVRGHIGVRITALQHRDGDSDPIAVGRIRGPLNKIHFNPMHFVFNARGSASHSQYIQHWLTREFPNRKQAFAYREGMLNIPGTDAGSWEQYTFPIDLFANFDHRFPLQFTVELYIPHLTTDYPESPFFLDDDFSAYAEKDEADPEFPARRNLFCNVVGASVWSN